MGSIVSIQHNVYAEHSHLCERTLRITAFSMKIDLTKEDKETFLRFCSRDYSKPLQFTLIIQIHN